MVIVSPWANPGYTDSNVAIFASMLAFTEHAFHLRSLGGADVGAYDFRNSFDFAQTPNPPLRLAQHPLPPAEKAWLKSHPPDQNDPT
jgi:hypothetical protein